MNTFHKAFITLAIGAAAAAAHARMTIVIEGSRTIDAAALVGEDSGSADLSRRQAASSRAAIRDLTTLASVTK